MRKLPYCPWAVMLRWQFGEEFFEFFMGKISWGNPWGCPEGNLWKILGLIFYMGECPGELCRVQVCMDYSVCVQWLWFAPQWLTGMQTHMDKQTTADWSCTSLWAELKMSMVTICTYNTCNAFTLGLETGLKLEQMDSQSINQCWKWGWLGPDKSKLTVWPFYTTDSWCECYWLNMRDLWLMVSP